jgi:hypothetical protein
MYYFKSTYEPCAYSPNWYGSLSYAPNATVLMYNDEEGYCIGYMEVNNANVEYITEVEATEIIAEYLNTENPNIWLGDRLLHRWEVTEDGK